MDAGTAAGSGMHEVDCMLLILRDGARNLDWPH